MVAVPLSDGAGPGRRPSSASEALQQAQSALRRAPDNPQLMLQVAHCHLALGDAAQACSLAAAAQVRSPTEVTLLDAIGNLFSRAGDQRRALAAFEQAIRLAPEQPHLLFNRATVRRFLGDLAGAEQDYDRVLHLRPDDHEAYLNRSELRPQVPERNHTAQLEALLARGIAAWRGEVALRFALAKEYEDLGEHAKSFAHLAHGARLRRQHMQYDVAVDVATADWIIEAHAGIWPVDETAAAGNTAADPMQAPIFIVGMPRCGSTLVERILGSHSTIRAAGELPHFALSVVAGVAALAPPGGPRLSRHDLVMRSARIDFGRLGEDYLDRVRAGGVIGTRFTDKMPLNYLYCGLIRRALPRARIIHVTRHPMAACYAMFKTLFQDGYPFSYELGELGRYYIAYRRLMDHWKASLPGAFHELSYEALVANQRRETERLLDFCGLAWEERCMRFDANAAPSTTASAAQVRRPLYNSSVGQWRFYAAQLEPLRQQLLAAGIDVEAQ